MNLPHNDMRVVGEYIDHSSQARPGIQVFPDRLFCIAVVSNPVRYRKRYELYRAFEKHMADSGVVLITVEVSHGDRRFEVTDPANQNHLQLHSHHLQEVWLKENMINLGIQHLSRLHPDWKYVAWIDADVKFTRPDWAQETLHQLQHYVVVQPWAKAYDLDAKDEVMETHQSFGYSLVTEGVQGWDKQFPTGKHEPVGYYGGVDSGTLGAYWHPGFAWAARREFFTTTGGMFEVSGLGAGDFIMALAIINKVDRSYHGGVSAGFKQACQIWQEKAKKLYRNMGYCSGSVLHYFHGTKANRKYQTRWSYLTSGVDGGLDTVTVDNLDKFDPYVDLVKDHQGLLQIPEEKIDLRDGFRRYFRDRGEDAEFFS